ncbi:MAG TPA: hypothetical protein VKN99_27685 [Polyangia bacterium]|nr:hypothetical protein [Polyangia bacterium]
MRARAAEIACVGAGMGLLLAAALVNARWFERHFLRYYAFTDSSEPKLLVLARVGAAALGIFLLVVVRPRLRRRAGRRGAARRSARRLASMWLRIALALAVALGTSELALRWHYGPPPPPDAFPLPLDPRDLPLAQHDLRLGWVLTRSRTTVQSISGRTIHFAVNADGDRARTQDEKPDPERPTVVFTGESIAVGHGLEWDETYPAQVGARLGLQVQNLAVPAYGTDQSLLRLSDALPRLHRPVAVVNLFVAAQLERNVWDFRPRLGLARDGTLVSLPSKSGLLHRLRLYGLLRGEMPYHDDSALPLTRALLRATAARVRGAGARPLFVMMRWRPSAEFEDWLVGVLFEPDRLPLVRVDIDPAFRLPADGHPDARAMRPLTDAIVGALSQN